MMEMQDYQHTAMLTLTNERDLSHREMVMRIALSVAGEAGEVAEQVKKYARGDFDSIELKRRLEDELGDVLWSLAVLARLVDLRLERVARFNANKLRSRRDRNAIKGDGSDR